MNFHNCEPYGLWNVLCIRLFLQHKFRSTLHLNWAVNVVKMHYLLLCGSIIIKICSLIIKYICKRSPKEAVLFCANTLACDRIYLVSDFILHAIPPCLSGLPLLFLALRVPSHHLVFHHLIWLRKNMIYPLILYILHFNFLRSLL